MIALKSKLDVSPPDPDLTAKAALQYLVALAVERILYRSAKICREDERRMNALDEVTIRRSA